MEASTNIGALDRAAAQHRDLRRLHGSLLEYLERPRPEPQAPDSHQWASRLYKRLAELHERVSAHYRLERRPGGVMTWLIERYPRASRQLEQLDEEHERILQDLRAIVSAAMSYAEAKSVPNPRLREWTREMLESLSDHESRSTQIIQDLVSTDVGAGD